MERESARRIAKRKKLRYLVIVGAREFGRLAQLVERVVDVDEVRGSNPLPPTGASDEDGRKRRMFSCIF